MECFSCRFLLERGSNTELLGVGSSQEKTGGEDRGVGGARNVKEWKSTIAGGVKRRIGKSCFLLVRGKEKENVG